MNFCLLHTFSPSAPSKRCRINVYKFAPPKTISCSVSPRLRRHHRRRLLKHHTNPDHFSPPSGDQNLQIVLAADRLSRSKPVTYISELVDASRSKLSRFIHAADDAFEDLQTLVTVDGATKRAVVSCRRSTVQFLGFVLLSSLLIVFVFRVLINLLIGNSDSFSDNNGGVIYRRDRSLGGRQVAVGKVDTNFRKSRNKKMKSENDMLVLMLESGNEMKGPFWERRKKRSAGKLPQWWPVSSPGPSLLVENKEEYQMMANRLIRAYKFAFQRSWTKESEGKTFQWMI